MAITEAFAGTQAIGSGEHSFTTDQGSPSPDVATTDGVYQVICDLSDMVTGDELQLRVYEKTQASDAQGVIYQSNLVGPQSSLFVFPSLVLMHGWDVTGRAISGTITVTWSIRKVA